MSSKKREESTRLSGRTHRWSCQNVIVRDDTERWISWLCVINDRCFLTALSWIGWKSFSGLSRPGLTKRRARSKAASQQKSESQSSLFISRDGSLFTQWTVPVFLKSFLIDVDFETPFRYWIFSEILPPSKSDPLSYLIPHFNSQNVNQVKQDHVLKILADWLDYDYFLIIQFFDVRDIRVLLKLETQGFLVVNWRKCSKRQGSDGQPSLYDWLKYSIDLFKLKSLSVRSVFSKVLLCMNIYTINY